MQTTEDPSIASIIGKSLQILDLKQAVLKIAPRNTTVLLTGETGTGKELFAQALHQGSLRRFKPFVKVNCAAIPESLLESELFGYAEGTFTGGKKGGYLGKFAIADGGTVFLDELAELPLSLQAKLLRFLQEHEIQRLGESMPRRVNVRIVAATNANLAQLVKYQKFRSDLYYRLNVLTLEIPPLRNRREDIPLLCQSFLKSLNVEFDYRVYRLGDSVKSLFEAYSWPGNVRELHNTLEAAFHLFDGGQEIRLEHLPQYLQQWYTEKLKVEQEEDQDQDLDRNQKKDANAKKYSGSDHDESAEKPVERNENKETGFSESAHEAHEESTVHLPGMPEWLYYARMVGKHSLANILDELEAEILHYLLEHESNRSHVAEMLGISRQALYKKMHKYFHNEFR